ncbi:MAG: YbfB/YjiJ family MFS transporter [Betaproteobacteria bacterium]|nr:YbfB/YjiJ family MFS transporter [Betaproteobacteria bacterium]
MLSFPRRQDSPLSVALTCALTLAIGMGIGRFAFTPLLPMMQADEGVSLAQGGWLASANYIGYLAGALLAPLIRVPLGAMVRFSLFTVFVVTLAMGLVENLALWMALRAVAGVMSAWLLIYVSGWCLEALARHDRAGLAGVLYGGMGAGIMLTGAICLALMLAGADAKSAWRALGAIALVLSLIVWPVFTMPGYSSNPAAKSDWKLSADGMRLILCNAANGFGYIIPATFLPAMARDWDSDPALFGWAWPVFGAATLASTLTAGVALRFMGNRQLGGASHLIMAFGVALPVFMLGLDAIMISALAVGATFMVATMCALREARAIGKEHATRLLAAVTASFAIGQIAGPLCVPLLATPDNPYAPALLLAALLLSISGVVLAWPPPQHYQGDQP